MMPLWRCDFCGGAAAWAFDAHGSPWFSCHAQCDRFMQLEIWSEEMEPGHVSGVLASMRGDDFDVADQKRVPEGLPF